MTDLEPDSGESLLGQNLLEVTTARRDQFEMKPARTFRIGDGGAVTLGNIEE